MPPRVLAALFVWCDVMSTTAIVAHMRWARVAAHAWLGVLCLCAAATAAVWLFLWPLALPAELLFALVLRRRVAALQRRLHAMPGALRVRARDCHAMPVRLSARARISLVRVRRSS